VSYHAVFHDYPDYLETHVYAPLGLDIRGKWSVGGSLPGEPKERSDYGLKVPRTGLYIKEEVKMTCSKLLIGFVKKTFKDSHSHLVEKLVERAHILESTMANQRLKALRSVDPRERMGHGDIFIAPPPDYQFSPPPYRSQASPRLSPHVRSQSANTILTPSASQPTFFFERASISSLPEQQERPSSSSALSPKASSAPAQGLYLLPATTYDGGLSSSFNQPVSLYPGTSTHPPSIRVVSTCYETMVDGEDTDTEPDQEPDLISSNEVNPPQIPEVRPMSFDLSFEQRSPGPRTPISNEDLLAHIDAAIDESFMYASPDTRYSALPTPNALQATFQYETLPAKTYELLPATTYSASTSPSFDILPSTTYGHARAATVASVNIVASVDILPSATYQRSRAATIDTLAPTKYDPAPQTLDILPSTTYSPAASSTTYSPGAFLPSTKYTPNKRERKDSAVPYHAFSEEEEVPPVPPKDEKYRRPSQVAVSF